MIKYKAYKKVLNNDYSTALNRWDFVEVTVLLSEQCFDSNGYLNNHGRNELKHLGYLDLPHSLL